MSFDDWWEENYMLLSADRTEAEEIWSLGAASRQDKVDELHKNIETLHVDNERIKKEYQMMFEGVQGRQQTINELQKRIDGALDELDFYFGDNHPVLNAIKILKDEENE